MSLVREAKLQESLRGAMKSRDAVEVGVLRGLLAAIKNTRIERRIPADGELDEAEIVAIVRREIKQREEAIGFAERGGRTDLVEKNRSERAILERLLPRGVERVELVEAVRRHLGEGAVTIGALMAKLKEEFGTRLDGRVASEVVREQLQGRGGA